MVKAVVPILVTFFANKPQNTFFATTTRLCLLTLYRTFDIFYDYGLKAILCIPLTLHVSTLKSEQDKQNVYTWLLGRYHKKAVICVLCDY